MFRLPFHTLDLSRTTHTAHGDTYVDGRAEALIEEVALKIYLSVCNGNHVRRDICGNVASLRLDDWQGGKRTATLYMALHALRQVVHLLGNFLLVVDSCGTLKKTAVQIEHVARISLTSGRRRRISDTSR